MLTKIVGLVAGLAFLLPAILFALFQLGLGGLVPLWLTPLVHIALSVPMLAFCTLAGFAMIFWTILRHEQDDEPLSR